jgi:hypothetical protein
MIFDILLQYLPFQIKEYLKNLNLITREEYERLLPEEIIEHLIPYSSEKNFILNFFKRINGKISQAEIILNSTLYEMKEDIENFRNIESKIKIKQWMIDLFREYGIPFLVCEEIKQLSNLKQVQDKISEICKEFLQPETDIKIKISYKSFFMKPNEEMEPVLIILYSYVNELEKSIESFSA